MTIINELNKIFFQFLQSSFPENNFSQSIVEIKKSTHKQYGDMQCNTSMRLAKELKMNPKKISEIWCDAILTKHSSAFELNIQGPGFINIKINNNHLIEKIKEFSLQAKQNKSPKKILIDYSSPNIAKEMHVGHLRSTIVGDSLANILEYLGHNVDRTSFIGDWGTSFGMLVAFIKTNHPDFDSVSSIDISKLQLWYQQAREKFEKEPEFNTLSKKEVVNLQALEPKALSIWKKIVAISKTAYQEIYNMLDVHIVERGESYYKDHLQDIVDKLSDISTVSDNATCIFLPGFTGKNDMPLPFIIKKSDGGFNYATFDLAALNHRINTENYERIIIVTDNGQSLHFKMLFAVAYKASLVTNESLEHVPLGLVLGNDGKKFKTRSGKTEKLVDLLYESINRAKSVVETKNPDLSVEKKNEIAKVIGIGAVKYADLSTNRENDYQFSYDKMLQFEGNTISFILYAYVRCVNVLSKSKEAAEYKINSNEILIVDDIEREIILYILDWHNIISFIEESLYPHLLCDYLYEGAKLFHKFFANCKIINGENKDLRLLLCEIMRDLLYLGLKLLGCKTTSNM